MEEQPHARARQFLRAIGVDEQSVDLPTYRHDSVDQENETVTARWRDVFGQEQEQVVSWSVIRQVMAKVEPPSP